MLDQLKSLLVETPLMITVFSSSLTCRHLSRPWRQLIGGEANHENLRIADLFENGSQVFVEHYAQAVLKKNEQFIGLPAKIKGLNGSQSGTLAIWGAELDSNEPAVVVAFTPSASREAQIAQSQRGVEAAITNGSDPNGSHKNANNESALKSQLDLAQKQLNYLQSQIDEEFCPLIGQSNSFRRIREQVQTVAQTPANVLIVGELGTGKETVARAIHRDSRRAKHPFVKVNCASIPPANLVNELFGVETTAPTDAVATGPSLADSGLGKQTGSGKLALADRGTLFLEEVAALNVDAQSMLLESIQAHEVGRSPSTFEKPVDVRIIVSNRRDLQLEVSDGHFREDLYCRLSVFQINTPILSERADDIIGLTQFFLRSICREIGRPILIVTSQQISQLQSLSWPGNALELKRLIERAVMVSSGNHLRLDLVLPSDALNIHGSREITGSDFFTEDEFNQMERKNILAALQHAGWRISGTGGAAELLGVKPSTLTYRMKKLNIERE